MPTQSASDFIRSQPRDFTASQVLAAAVKAGLKPFHKNLVYLARGKPKAKAGAPKSVVKKAATPAPKKARAKRGTRGRPPKGKTNASAFVRSLPRTMSIGDVVAAGAQRGIKFSRTLVYMVRRNAAKKSRNAAPPTRAATAGRAGTSESTFRRLVLELGVGRARGILDDIERAVAKLITG